MRKLWLAVAVITLPLSAAGCAALSANTKPSDQPAMNVPPAPARVIEPAPEPLPEPVAELPVAPPSPTATRGSRPAPPPSRPPATAEPRAEQPKPVDPPPQDPAPVPQPPAAPPAQLRTPQTADTGNAEKGVRSTLDRAKGLLSNVDYRLLNAERKKAYDDAMRFMKQSEDKLKQGDLVFAQAVAEKAELLARELAGK